jgi:hypothetical protein
MLRLRHALILLMALPATALAQNSQVRVNRDSFHDVSLPLRELPPGPRLAGILEAEPVRRIPVAHPVVRPDPVLQAPRAGLPRRRWPLRPPELDGVGNGVGGSRSIAARHQCRGRPQSRGRDLNTDLAVFSKTGAIVPGPVAINTLWSGFAAAARPTTTAIRLSPTTAGRPLDHLPVPGDVDALPAVRRGVADTGPDRRVFPLRVHLFGLS